MLVLALGALLLSSTVLAFPRPHPGPRPRPVPDTVPGGVRGPAFNCPLGYNCNIGGCPPFLGCATAYDCFPYPGFPPYGIFATLKVWGILNKTYASLLQQDNVNDLNRVTE